MYKITDELALVRFDKLNLAIVKGFEPKSDKGGWGNRVVSYHSTIQSAFKYILKMQLLGETEGVEAKDILQRIDELHKQIDSLDMPTMRRLMKGTEDE